MATFTVHTSSSLTRLASELSARLAAAPSPPLAREAVVVLSNGMGRWLSMELASACGVSAGMDFRFPNDTLDACFRSVIPGLPESSPFALDTMAWRIAALLPTFLNRPGFESISSYLGEASDDRRLLQLSRKLADTFDQYTIFRPQMVLGWDKGRDGGWQAELWRALSAGCNGLHRAALLQQFRQRLKGGTAAASLPPRISLFGISFLPPFHLEFFSIVSRHADVDFYLLNPCGSFWGDLFSERRKAELALEHDIPPEALEYYETGNPLLSSLGTQGQEFFGLLLETDPDWNDLDGEPCAGKNTLLGTIQGDILRLCDRGVTTPRAAVDTHDRSLQVHSCHGPLREMEVLYDNLLRLFEDNPGLEPRDIVVMAPDIGVYAPYITATFGTRCGGRPAIPFTIADQSKRRHNQVLDTFLRILELPAGRFGINSVLEILECPQVMARFELGAEELGQIREWLHTTGVRWGIDGAHRASLGFPGYEECSWRAGLDRLLLGYALAPEGDRLFSGIMPCGTVEGRRALALGKLASFVKTAERMAVRLSARQSLAEWSDSLASIAGQLLSPLDGNDTSCAELHAAFQELRGFQERSGFDSPIGLEAVHDCLTLLLEQAGESFGFLGGRVTFCAMLPMRSIPLRVVCLVGMNDAVFPRNQRLPAFSLMAGARRRGDRSLRDEDRYLFLEALMSAGDTLYISYTGQNDRDNTSLPPSVVVSELLDYVRRAFVREGTSDLPPEIVTRHRLQSFSSDYHSGGADAVLFSYSPENRDALESGRLSGLPQPAFMHAALPDDPHLTGVVDLQQLNGFLGNPARAFLARRMKVNPHGPADELEEREPFALDSLSRYTLRQELTGRLLNDETCDSLYDSVRARGGLPPLVAGRVAFQAALEECSEFAGLVSPQRGDLLEPLPFSAEVHGFQFSGQLTDLRQGLHLRWRCADMKARDRLALWCEHLVLNTLAAVGYPRTSRLVCRDLTLDLPPLDNAREILADLLDLHRLGMCRPLHFFPQASWLYLTKGMPAAEGRWYGSDHSPSPAESSDASFVLCFNGRQVLDDEFTCLASRIFGPMRTIANETKNP